MEFHEYFTHLVKGKYTTKREIATLIGKSEAFVYQLMTGAKKPPVPEKMLAIAKALDFSKEKTERLMEYSYKRVGGKTYKGKWENPGITLAGSMNEIPIISWVHADKFDQSKFVEDVVNTEIAGEQLFGLRVENNCMEPEFRHGDIVVIDPSQEWKNGDFVVVRLLDKEESTFKQLKMYDSKIVLHPLNPSYNDIEFERREFDKQAKVIGRVVQKLKRY